MSTNIWGKLWSNELKILPSDFEHPHAWSDTHESNIYLRQEISLPLESAMRNYKSGEIVDIKDEHMGKPILKEKVS